jgi:prevent-host-death family protein
MGLASQIKPISYLKANAAEIANTIHEKGEPLIITRNGEAAMVVMSIEEYEKIQETFALLQLLALGEAEIERGEVEPAEDVIRRLRGSR